MDVSDEAGVDEGDALGGGYRREQVCGLGGARGDPYVEAQRPEIAFERRSGYRRTGEDCGRQTDSLLGADHGWARRLGPGPGGGMSAEAIG
ncbi:hypothetical protein ACIQMR_11045 [Streptomyces sp. NPDC091376]|uniref:hypothetical protein n=1 Tax=Streptomyces sp. NPDC091376 TaxID=3365994 RepID=UPI003829081F